MRRLQNQSALAWLLVAFLSLPALLYAYLGLSSRLMGDDFGLFATSLHLSGWHNFQYWWNGWYSSYTFILFNDLLAPLGPEYIAQALPTINIALWLLGLTWLYAIALRRLQAQRSRLPIGVALAAVTIAATFTSFQTWESIFWYAASVRYVLPIGLCMIFLAAAIDFADSPRSQPVIAAVSGIAALVCFVNAGFSELHAGLQLLVLSLALPFVYAMFDRSWIRSDIMLLAAGWLGSAVGLLLQMLAPGWSARVEKLLQIDSADPVRSLPQLLADTTSASIEFISYPAGILSLLLVMTSGIVAALIAGGHLTRLKTAEPVSLSASTIAAGLAAQLCFVPSLWRKIEDPFLVNGYLVGAAINALFIVVFVFVLWRRRQINALLAMHANRVMLYIVLILGGGFAMIAMTQLNGISATLSRYLFASALLLLGMLSWQLRQFMDDARLRRFGLATAASVVLALGAWALPVAVGNLSLGFVFKRTLVFSTLMQILSTLIWGGYLGCLIGGSCSLSPTPSTWIARLAGTGMLIVASITIGILWMQARLIPEFQLFAQDWDARHRRIIQLRESGEGDIKVAPLRFDLSAFIAANDRTFDEVSHYFYGVDSIVAAADGEG